ncbi:dinucleotide-utilizing enzyme [Microbacterium sp. NPDC077184]|uniref:dinucleotide-utilizing enzyme n=1 Tax=Microbacterium sp. NPDC077184 TaxID=3154764 RepID=UPI00341C783B
MTTRPPLARSIPFWVLLVGSVATTAVGAWLVSDRLGIMTATLNDGTATGVEVYVGQSVAVLGAILIGAGVIGILLALAVAAAATLRPHAVTAPPAYVAPDTATPTGPAVVADEPVTTAPFADAADLDDAARDGDAPGAANAGDAPAAEDADLEQTSTSR